MTKTRLTVVVAPGLSSWAWSDPDEALILAAGARHVLEEPSADLLRAVGAAVSAGSLELVEASGGLRKELEAVVEPEKESLKHLAAADEIRAELIKGRDQELEEAARSRSEAFAGDADLDDEAVKDEAAGWRAKQDQILAAHDDRVDQALRERLGEEN